MCDCNNNKNNVNNSNNNNNNKNELLIYIALLRPDSDAVLHMSRIEYNELSSCEVRRLNQFETADLIRIGLAGNNRCGPALIQTPIFT